MISKVIYLINSPFNQRDHTRFGIKTLETNGFDIEVWEFTPFLKPDVHKKVKPQNPFNYQNHRLFLAKEDAVEAISSLRQNHFIICIIPYDLRSYPIYKAISKSNLNYALLLINAIPTLTDMDNKQTTLRTIFAGLKKITLRRLKQYIFMQVPQNWLGISHPILFFVSSKIFLIRNPNLGEKSEIVWTHTLDYDIYLKDGCEPVQTDNSSAVFVDEYLPFNSDYIHLELEPFTRPEEYYPLLCKFFGFLEEKYNIKIVIAAHPKSSYEEHPDYFDGRPVIKGKTCDLIRKSKFVIAHCSTSVNFAVLFEKPVIFTTTNELRDSLEGPVIEAMAAMLGKKVINLNGAIEMDIERELTIDKEKYLNYRNSYIKMEGTEELPFWQIVANRLKRMV